MNGEDFDHHLNALEQGFQALRDQAGDLPGAREALAPALQEVAQALAAFKAVRQPELTPGSPETILSHFFEAIPDLVSVIDRDFNIVMSNWHGHRFIPEADRCGQPKCYRVYRHQERPCEECHLREVFASGRAVKVEKTNPIDGRSREIIAFPIMDESGRVVLVTEHMRDITDRKQVEAALHESEELYRSLSEKSLAGVYLIQDGIFRYVNPVLAQIFGYTPEEIKGRMSPGDTTHPDDLPLINEIARQRLAGEVEETCVTFKGLRRDGTVIHLEGLGRRIDYQGRPAILGTLLNITERQRAEEALRDSEKKYRGLIETTSTGYVIIDPGGKVLDANPEYVRVSGHDKLENILGHSVIEWTSNGDRARNAAEVNQCFQNGSVKNLELHYQGKDGRLIPVEINATAINTSEGLKVLSLVRDITDRKQAQGALQTQARVLESMVEAVTVFSEDGYIVFANPAAYAIFGYPEGELIGQHIMVLNDLSPAENEQFVREAIEQLQEKGTWFGEIRNRTKSGTPFISSARVSTLELDGKKLWISVQEDITARKQLEKATEGYLQFIQLLLETIPNPVFYKDAQGILLGCNRAFAEHAGVPKEEIPGKTVYDFFPGGVAKICEEGDQQAWQHPGIKVQLDFKLPADNGSQRQMKCHKAACIEASGSIGGVVSVLTDITDLQQAQEALRESEARYRTLFETSPHATMLMDLQLNINMLNQRGLGLFGFGSLEEAMATNGLGLIAPEDRPHAALLIQEMLETGETVSAFLNVLKQDRTQTPCLVTSSLVRNAAGDPEAITTVVQDISDLKRAEEAVQESEARLRAIFEHAPVGIIMLDAAGRFLQTNPAFQAIVGYSAAELQSLTCQGITHREDLPVQARLQEELLVGQRQYYSIEKRCLRKDGGVVWVTMMLAHLLNAQGEPRAVGTIIDITARKQAEEALRESEQRFRLMAENIEDDFWISTGTFDKLLYVSPGYEHIWGYPVEELYVSPQAYIKAVHPEDLEQVKTNLAAILAQPVPWSQEYRIIRPDGELRWVQDRGFPVRDEQGHVILFTGVAKDITERKQAEMELRESEQRFRLMAETIQDVFWIASPGIAKTKYVSPRYEQLWGRSREELYQSSQTFLETIYPEDRQRVKSETFAAHDRGEPFSLEYRIIRPDGEMRWIQDRGFPVRDEQGDVILFTGVATDITERKILEQQLLLAQKMEAVGRLAGGVAHDFNNLLMAITGYGEIMQAKILIGDPLYNYLNDILKATDRAAALTKQLLTFSRQQIVNPQVIDLNRVVLDLEQMLRRLIEEDIELTIITGPDQGMVKADPGYLNQIIMNLVINARDAIPCGGQIIVETGEVEFDQSRQTRFGVAPPGSYVTLEVSDNGIGMDESIQAHIFEPFFTTKEQGKGTGLGLSIVYGIIKQSGGFIDLESEPGFGTTFTVYLPRLEAATESVRPKMPKMTQFRGDETILLVEDEEVLRTLLAKFLRLYGYTVLEACHGGEALQICEQCQGPIHMMVTDVVMPQMSGRVLADRLSPLRPELKVLFMSGYTEDEVIQRGVTQPSVAFLQKPFKPIDLARQVRAILHPPKVS